MIHASMQTKLQSLKQPQHQGLLVSREDGVVELTGKW